MIERFRERVLDWLARHVVWVTDQRRAFVDEGASSWAAAVVVGREHYRETRKSYPIRSWRDLSSTLALENAANPSVLTFIGPWRDERREVSVFEINPAFVAHEPQSVFWIPESLLVAQSLTAFELADIDRDGVRYFCSRLGASQLQGGLIRTADSYALGVGIPSTETPLALDAAQLRLRLFEQLRHLPLSHWLRALQPGVWGRAIAWLRPAAVFLAASLLVYFCLASIYLLGTTQWREYQLRRMGPEVGILLTMQRQVDSASKEVNLLAGALRSRPDAYRMWEVASVVWKLDGAVANFVLTDREVTIRGSAPVATDVLSAVGKLQGFEGAKFGAPVRQSGSREEFTIVVRLASAAVGAKP